MGKFDRAALKTPHNTPSDKASLQQTKNKYKNIDEIKKIVQNNNKFNQDLEILNYINSGSCGIVYEGKIRRPVNKRVALKFILNMNKMIEEDSNMKLKQLRKDEIHIKNKIFKEISLQNKLKHKNITLLYGVYEIQNVSSCMVMEYAKYGDLDVFQKKLQKKCLSETLIAYFSKQILNGLYYCHQSKIIHMDIKQQNILIDENLQVKLADLSVSFNYSNYDTKAKVTLPLAGTSLFMSPEVLWKKEIDIEDCNKVDLFSFGTLLYNLAFDGYPYGLEYSDKRNFDSIKQKISSNKPFIAQGDTYSSKFYNFIERLLNPVITKRMSINEAMNDPWIKGADYIFKEKEKIADLEKFLTVCVIDNIRSFNEYLIGNIE